jgi:hypothetical protein
MNGEIYVDQISNIYVNGTMVRIDFASLNPALSEQADQPVFEHKLRVVMTLDAFTNGLSMQENIVAKLIENGVLMRRDEAGGKNAQ